jgi:hypothetical protein
MLFTNFDKLKLFPNALAVLYNQFVILTYPLLPNNSERFQSHLRGNLSTATRWDIEKNNVDVWSLNNKTLLKYLNSV